MTTKQKPIIEITPINSVLLRRTQTTIYREKPEFKYHIPNHYFIVAEKEENGKTKQDTIQSINFQKGSVVDNGINGITNEDLIAVVINRLQHNKITGEISKNNKIPIMKLQEALMWLNKNTDESIMLSNYYKNKK